MTLGEAELRLKQLDYRLMDLQAQLADGSLQSVTENLDEAEKLLKEKHQLQSLVLFTAIDTPLDENNSLHSVKGVLKVLKAKISCLEIISCRTDLTEDVRASVNKNLTLYRDTRDSFEIKVQECSWSTQLLK